VGKKCDECGKVRGDNGNCPDLGNDKLPVQCVGYWAARKHHYLKNYIEATCEVRKKFLTPYGGAAYIDIYAGPGRARIRDEYAEIDGSPLIAAQHDEAAFTHLLFGEADDENRRALSARLKDDVRHKIIPGDCNEVIGEIVSEIPSKGLNVAFVDPFGASNLRWSTVAALGALQRMDIILHFPTSGIKRNFHNKSFHDTIDQFLGTADWRKTVRVKKDVHKLATVYLRRQLAALGYDETEEVRSVPVKRGGQILYHLLFASKHIRGAKIWNSITKVSAAGQRSLF
jgi:three-Cys-motif partner protein